MPPRERRDEREPTGREGGDHVIDDAVGHVLVEDPFVAERLQVQFEAFELDADAIGHVAEREGAEIGLAGLGTDRRELRADDLDRVVPIGKQSRERLEQVARGAAGGRER